MATDVNKASRKRKSASDLIFEIDEADCSPSNTPEPVEDNISCSISETEVSQASTDVSKTSMATEEIISRPEIPKTDVDLRCMDMEVENCSPPSQDTNKPFVTLIFRDKDVANNLKSKLVSYIKNLVNLQLNEESESDSETKIHLWEKTEPLNLDLFVVDTTPSKSREILPKYSPNLCNVIEDLDPEKPNGNEENPTSFRPQSSCFNCDGNHAIKDCKEVKDYRRICMARSKFMAGAQAKSVRYHLDDEQKYKHLVPGKISDKLRKALDIRKHELPPYIYRMRSLGYPPGWLQEAMVTTSKLELFDFQGCAVGDGGGDTNRMIDSSKVVDYPGFNVPLEKGDKDDFKYYRCPPYSEQYSKTSMLDYIERISEVQQMKSPVITKIEEIKNVKCEESDSNSQGSECAEQVKRNASPTLTDLELRKKQLLAELEDGSINSPQPIIPELDKTTEREATPPPLVIESPNVMSSSFGTPIIKTASPYFHLPDPDKFSKDISQVINFENLPNYTGKYEQMSKVISKVRDAVKNVPSDNKS